jgi:hypothetical protein
MTKYVYKRNHTKEYYDKVSEDSRKEKLKYQRRKQTKEERKKKRQEDSKWQSERMKRELAEIKALKPQKVPLTAEEKEQKKLDRLKEAERKEKELRKKTYIPPNIMVIMSKIRKIYKEGRLEDLASETGICEHYFISWLNSDRRPQGSFLKDLQEYFAKN